MSNPQNRPLRVVIDTSVLLAILRHDDPGQNWLIELWRAGTIVPLVSQETLHELEQKLLEHSPSPNHYQATKFVERAIRRYQPWCEQVEPLDSGLNPKCEDRDDQIFVDLACEGSADVILARDRKLLDMAKEPRFEVMTDRAFRGRLEDYHIQLPGQN